MYEIPIRRIGVGTIMHSGRRVVQRIEESDGTVTIKLDQGPPYTRLPGYCLSVGRLAEHVPDNGRFAIYEVERSIFLTSFQRGDNALDALRRCADAHPHWFAHTSGVQYLVIPLVDNGTPRATIEPLVYTLTAETKTVHTFDAA